MKLIAQLFSSKSPTAYSVRFFWLSLFGTLLFMKDPLTQLWPVLWAEEASVYFAHALNRGSLSILTFIYDRSMRFELLMNVAAALAAILPLKLAPYITATLSFSVYLLSFYLILSRELCLFPYQWQRVLGCLAILLSCFSLPGNVFMSTAVVQHTMGCVALVLLFVRNNAQEPSSRRCDLIILFFCGLSGLYAVFLTPLFILKGFLTRHRSDFWSALIMAVCLSIQLWVMLQAADTQYTNQFRGVLSLESPLLVFRVLVLKMVLGQQLSQILVDLLPASLFIGPMLIIGMLAVWAYWIYRRGSKLGEWFLILAWIVSAAAVTYSAAGGIPDGRYAGLPRTVLFFTLIQFLVMPVLASSEKKLILILRRNRVQTSTIVIGIILASSIWTGLTAHFQPFEVARQKVPKWIDEIDRFNTIDNYLITVFPAPRWKLNLTFGAGLGGFQHIVPDRIYKINDLVPWKDFYQLEQPNVVSDDQRYISQSTVLFELRLSDSGQYQLEALTQAPDSSHDSWFVRTEWIRRKTIAWHIPISDEWRWSRAPEIWELPAGRHRFLLEPREATPLAAIRVKKLK